MMGQRKYFQRLETEKDDRIVIVPSGNSNGELFLLAHFFEAFLSRMTKVVVGKIKGKRREWEAICKQKSVNWRLCRCENVNKNV